MSTNAIFVTSASITQLHSRPPFVSLPILDCQSQLPIKRDDFTPNHDPSIYCLHLVWNKTNEKEAKKQTTVSCSIYMLLKTKMLSLISKYRWCQCIKGTDPKGNLMHTGEMQVASENITLYYVPGLEHVGGSTIWH